MRVAVVGSGVAGLTAARTLALAGVEVVLYEKDSHVGGHAHTLHVDGVGLDVGFMVFNQVTYPNMVTFFEEVGVEIETSDMSFAVSMSEGRGCEWGSTGLAAVFAQKRNALNPFFWNMILEMVKFEKDVQKYLKRLENDDTSVDPHTTLGDFLQSHGYSKNSENATWYFLRERENANASAGVLFWNSTVFQLSKVDGLLFGRPQWLTVKGRSETYVNKVIENLKAAGAEIRISTAVTKIKTVDGGKVQLEDDKGLLDIFDKCVVATHAPDALKLRGQDATTSEKNVLRAFQYAYSDIYLHRDKSFMPRKSAAWSAWNFLGDIKGASLRNILAKPLADVGIGLQNLGDTGLPFLVTLNPPKEPADVESFWRTSHPIPTPEAANASKHLETIQGHHGVWYCGAYEGYGFHEDGLKSGLKAAKHLLNQRFETLGLVKHMVPSWTEYVAKQAVIAVLKKFIRTGHLQLLEAGGSVFDFVGNEKGCSLKCMLRIQNPVFYWKIATRADLGLADAYIDGDFSFVGKSEKTTCYTSLRDVGRADVENKQSGGWWNPLFVTASIASAVSYFRHAMRDNSLTNARRNISQHYDLSNDMFSLFLDETMTYSCAIFKGPDDTLRDAQLRKLHLMLDKGRIDDTHEVLEIGFGWGSMAIEAVRRTGCRYTGITLSEQQLKFAKDRVIAAGLEDHITFLLCDYRNLPHRHKYNRIISCEMLEAVGHEYYEEFFARCDYLLAKDGLVVLQTCSIPDERYTEYRRSSDFIKEYIFPGGCLPCLSALTEAMTAGSKLSVEHVQNIGPHYYQTLMSWRKNFLENSSEIRKLGFGEKFIRMWDYYFVYCAAGFRTCTLTNLQLVLSRPGNMSALGNPYVAFPMGLSDQWEGR